MRGYYYDNDRMVFWKPGGMEISRELMKERNPT